MTEKRGPTEWKTMKVWVAVQQIWAKEQPAFWKGLPWKDIPRVWRTIYDHLESIR
jgi:hypothetical protein